MDDLLVTAGTGLSVDWDLCLSYCPILLLCQLQLLLALWLVSCCIQMPFFLPSNETALCEPALFLSSIYVQLFIYIDLWHVQMALLHLCIHVCHWLLKAWCAIGLISELM